MSWANMQILSKIFNTSYLHILVPNSFVGQVTNMYIICNVKFKIINIMNDRILDISNKVKKVRDNNPILDALAGFIPGVGEAQDFQDFTHAAKNKDYLGMALATAGLVLPGSAASYKAAGKAIGNAIDAVSDSKKAVKAIKTRALTDQEKAKGFIKTKDKNGNEIVFNRNTGEEYVFGSKGNLITKGQAQSNKSVKGAKQTKLKEQEKLQGFNNMVNDFYNKTGLDFSLDNWQSLAKGHKMSKEEIELYTTKALPNFIKTYEELSSGTTPRLVKMGKGKWKAWFDEPVSPDINPKATKLKQAWNKGYRDINNIEAMQYIIAHSPQAKGKFVYTGIPSHQGIPAEKAVKYTEGVDKQNYLKWHDSNPGGAIAYSHGNGLELYTFPIKPSLINPNWDDQVRLIKQQRPNPTSNAWNGPDSPIMDFLSPDRARSINISEGPLMDDHATKVARRDIKGVFTIVGNDIPTKSVFGGSGMYDTSKENLYKPFMQWAAPIGLTSLIGLKAFNKDNEQK